MSTVRIGKALSIPNVAAIACTTLLICGCDTRSPFNERMAKQSPDMRDAMLESLDWPTGLREPNAPNLMLSYWAAGVRTTLPSVASGEPLACDANNAIDLKDVPLTPRVRAELLHLKNIEWLRLPSNTTAADLEWICELRQLQGISMDDVDLTGADFLELSALENLKWLNLSNVRMSTDDFGTLPPLKELQALFLEGALVNDEYLFHLADEPQPSLKRLGMPYSKVTDAGVYRLSGVYDLEYLGLFCCEQITDKSIEPISKMQSLRLLGVGATAICPDHQKNSGIAELQRRLPQTEVDYGD